MSNLCTRKTTDNSETINAEVLNATVANLVDLNVTNNTILNNVTITGTANIPGGSINLANINCQTLTASDFVKAKNNINEYALLQTTSSTDPDPNQSILSTSTGSAGLDIITLGTGKKIQLISTECHMVAGYSIFPTLPVGISLFSNTLIQIDSLTSTQIRATTTASMTCNLGLTLTGGTTAALTCAQALTLRGGTTALLETTSGDMTLQSGNDMNLLSSKLLKLRGAESAEFTTTNAGGTGNLLIRGYNATTVSSFATSLTLTGKTTASLTATDSSLTLSGATTAALSSTSGALTLTGGTTAALSSSLGLSLTGGTTASLTATTGALSLTGGTTASLTATTGALSLSGGTTAAISSTSTASITTTAGNINLNASSLAGVGGVISLSATSTIGGGGINGITLTTDTGGIALTTGLGAMALSTGGGAMTLAVGAGTIQIGSVLGGNIGLTSGTGAFTVAAPLGGVNFGTTGGSSTVGQFTVWTSNNLDPFNNATGNISMTTHGTGVLTGPGNITIDASDAYTGTMFLRSKGTFKIISNNGNSTGGIFLNTQAVSGAGSEYSWRYPAGPGTAGQVLTSQGTGAAQTWSTAAIADANNNISANNFFSSMFTLSTAGTTYNMTPASPLNTYTTATGSATIVLPNATLLPLGAQYYLNENNTAGVVAVQSFGGAAITNLRRGTMTMFILTTNGTSAGTWDHHHLLPDNVNWSNTAVNMPQSLTTSNTTLASSGVAASIVTAGGYAGVNSWLTSDQVLQNGVGGSFVSLRPSTGIYAPFNFTFPTSMGTSGQVLTSAGTGNALVWTTPAGGGGGGISSVGMSVPAFLSVTPANITTTGTFAVTLSGAALPVASGGTGATTSTGTGSTVRSTNPDLTAIIVRQQALQQAIIIYPNTVNTETSIFFQSQLTDTGNRWSVGMNVGNIGANTFAFYSTSGGNYPLLLTSTQVGTTVPIQAAVTGTASADTIRGLIPFLGAGNTASLVLGSAASTNNAALLQFVNTGGTGSALNSLNMGLFGTNFVTMTAAAATFSVPVNLSLSGTGNRDFQYLVPSLGIGNGVNFDFGISTNTNACGVLQYVKGATADANTVNLGLYGSNSISMTNVSMTLGKAAANVKIVSNSFVQITAGAQTPADGNGVYINQRVGYSSISPLPLLQRGGCNIGHADQGNCLFLATPQDEYLFSGVNANGVLCISQTQTNQQFVTFYKNYQGQSLTAIGSITTSGSNNVSYNQASDYRLKENVQDMTSMSSTVLELRPKTYAWVDDDSKETYFGFIAHEVQAVYPQAVTGEKDALDEYGKMSIQQMDHSKLIPILTKALQECITEIQQLKERIDLLESQ